MFVSSYSNFVPTSAVKNNKVSKLDEEKGRVEKNISSFKQILNSESINRKSLPLDYVKSNQAFSNKQEIEYKKYLLKNKNDDSKKLRDVISKQNTFIEAKTAYEQNSVIFSLIKKPNITLSQTPKIDEKDPKEFQKLKEKNLRHIMVNTYLENDKYYQITA